MINSNQVKGAVKDAAGKVQREVGEAVGSTEHQLKGAAKQAEGKTQKAAGNVQQNVEESANRADRKI